LEAAALAGHQWKTARTIEFDQLRLGSWCLDGHVEDVMRCAAATAAEREFFLRLGNFLSSDVVFEIRFGDAAQALLQPSASIMTNFHSVAISKFRLHSLGSSVHFFTHDVFKLVLYKESEDRKLSGSKQSKEIE
jgi:hypothetical protein